MTDQDLDRRLAALLAEPVPAPDAAFAERVVALAAHDLAVRRFRRRALGQVAREALALAAVLASFVLLARAAPGMPAIGPGDAVPLGSPAMIGMGLLALWGLAAARPAASA